MGPRLLVSAIWLWVAAWAAAAQTAPAGNEPAPDAKAYREASRIADPAKKIDALEQFKKDFPKAATVRSADQAIFSTLLKSFPGETARIRRQAKALYAGGNRTRKGRAASRIADDLLDAGILLDEAERYARKGVDSMEEAPYLAAERQAYIRQKVDPPSTGELLRRFREARAARLTTLGRVYLRKGQGGKSRKLLEESYRDDPDQPLAAAALGELAAREGRDSKALEYLVYACLAGKPAPEARASLETVYRRINHGSLEGLDYLLDGEYRRRYPNPIPAGKYKPTPNRSNRLVLAEVFTGAGCAPCAGADMAFDAALVRYARRDLAVIMYHVHVPRPDPMTNPDTQARYNFYGNRGAPTYFIDGKSDYHGGGSRDEAGRVFDLFNPYLEKDLESPPEARVKLEATLNGNTVTIQAAVEGVTGDSKDLKLQVALVEKQLRYTGENGVRFHPMVVRAMGGKDGAGFALDPASPEASGQVFDLDKVAAALKAHLDDYEAQGHRGEPFKFTEKKYEIDRGNLAVVAFVQDEKTKHVLQAAWVDLTPPKHPASED
jgi:hypothetical protein